MERRLARHQQFWGPKFEGEGAYFALASPLPQFRRTADRYDHWLDLEYRLEVLEESFDQAFFLGDAVPCLDPDFGPSFLPSLLGRPYKVSERTVWFDVEPFEDPDEIFGLSIQRESSYYRVFTEYTRRACEMSEGRFLVGVTDMGSEIDVLASLYNRESLLADMLLEPKRVKRLLEKVGEWWKEATLENERAIREWQDHTITWVPVANAQPWAPILSELAAMVSPIVFEDIIIPSIKRESGIYDQILFNVDGDSYARHLQQVLSLPKLHSIEWDPNVKYNASGRTEKDFTTPEAITIIRTILERKKIVFNAIPAHQVPYIMEHIPHDGVFFYLEFDSPSEARDFMEIAGRWMKKTM
jgi:hypothetical protein